MSHPSDTWEGCPAGLLAPESLRGVGGTRPRLLSSPCPVPGLDLGSQCGSLASVHIEGCLVGPPLPALPGSSLHGVRRVRVWASTTFLVTSWTSLGCGSGGQSPGHSLPTPTSLDLPFSAGHSSFPSSQGVSPPSSPWHTVGVSGGPLPTYRRPTLPHSHRPCAHTPVATLA